MEGVTKSKAHTIMTDHTLHDQPEYLDKVVQSVSDATKRLSQISTASTNNTKSSKRKNRDAVGPWKLGRTLGKGSSGKVRLAKNMENGQLAAIKIVSKMSSRDQNVPNNVLTYGIEREIIIMKLISHPNIMGLYEVWENKSELFLVLEYVEGGELFDYLVMKGKLHEKEAVHYFEQIIQGISYCHKFNICHRDLKPENLLLDKKKHRIKIADFGMAILESSNKLLETSCGSPHYASPEVVLGQKYHGSPSDVWSCGIILFAILTGHLPFNDDNVKKLLLKVQSGKYEIPQNLSPEAKDLISKMLIVDPEKRITIVDILKHPLLAKYSSTIGNKMNANLDMLNKIPTMPEFSNIDDIDESILKSLQILWRDMSTDQLIVKLLKKEFTEEKMFYSLLWQYHERQKLQGIPIQEKPENSIPILSTTQSSHSTIPDSFVGAPKIMQKSQFSLVSLKYPNVKMKDGYIASSSRVFRKSNSRMTISSITSQSKCSHTKRSLTTSNSRASLLSLKQSGSNKFLHLSESKKSLYSLHSISKRSLNLNEYLHDNFTPPLPQLELSITSPSFVSTEKQTIKEIHTNSNPKGSKSISSIVELVDDIDKNDLSFVDITSESSRQPLINISSPDTTPNNDSVTTNSVIHRHENTQFTLDRKLLITSQAPVINEHSQPFCPVYSLDPRIHKKNQSYNVEFLLDKSDLKEDEIIELHNFPISNKLLSEENKHNILSDISILAHSSTKEQSNHIVKKGNSPQPLRSSSISSSMTFKNLNQFLSDINKETECSSMKLAATKQDLYQFSRIPLRKTSSKLTLASHLALKPSYFKNDQYEQVSMYCSDSQYDDYPNIITQLDKLTNTFIFDETHMPISNHEMLSKSLDKTSEANYDLTGTQEEFNIFEDAPGDDISIATSPSNMDSQTCIQRKAVSIDTLNTTFPFTPTTDVRMSLYNSDNGSNIISRDNTAEIISKFKLSPEKPKHNQQKRFSYQNTNLTLSKSMMSMFKDLDEESVLDSDTNNKVVPPNLHHKTNKQEKRLTTLFDDRKSNIFEGFQNESELKPPHSENNIISEVIPSKLNQTSLSSKTETKKSLYIPKDKIKDTPLPNDTVKQNWFTKVINNISFDKTKNKQLIHEHKTKIPFECLHSLTLHQLNINEVDYELKQMNKKNGVKKLAYDCKFTQGNFKFKMTIKSNVDDRSTIIIKKKKRKMGDCIFDRFNNSIDNIIRLEEEKYVK